jgi:copper chaperone CopZ
MKTLKTLLIVALPILFLLSGSKISVAQTGESELKIKVEFHCNGGKSKIEREVSQVDGVKSIVADLETKIVTIKYDSSKLNTDKLVAEIEKTGHRTELSKKETVIKSDCGSHGVGDKNCDTPKK